jgi:hypothetical protein
MSALARASSNSERMLRKDYNRKCSVEKMLVVSLKELVAKMN